ncbi:MAG: hypothetical protein IJ356_05980 [Erysipelotrichaceae bacterium]|nr:hypothetical protein [Erysipelotrichaceae bacterium]
MEQNQLGMNIKPSTFSEETLEVLKLFEDEIHFFDIKLDDTAKSFAISIWQYQDDQWNEIGSSSGQSEFLGNRIAIRFDETAYEIYHMDENGHSSIKSPALDLKFEDTIAKISWRVDQEEILEMNKEKALFVKVGTNKSEVSTSIISTDFREVKCDTGIAITLTIFDKELTD